ncbi:response regulator [Streptomyces sp. NPDC001262]|uniref:response regulator n=1 Tax=unclassified Streptomyces TaxID=2593676 RepID=UPI00369ABBBE
MTPPAARPPVRVLVVDDQPLMRCGLRGLIDTFPDFETVAEAASGAEAVDRCRELRADIAVVDLRMPGMDGAECTARLLELPEPPKVLLLTGFPLDGRTLGSLASGAAGLLGKDLRPAELAAVLRSVAAGTGVVSSDVLSLLLTRQEESTGMGQQRARELLTRLSASEQRVLALVGSGMTNDQIADRLGLSGASVKTYVSRALAKLGLENRTQAALIVFEAELSAEPWESGG